MNKLLTYLILLCWALPMQGQKSSDFFVRVLPDREQVFAGDSMLVSVVLYATQPIAKAECSTDFEIKGGKCNVRKLSINRNATAGRSLEGRNIYYTMVWNQYVIAPQKPGTYYIPTQKFKATLQQVVSMPDLFEQMMGARPKYRDINVQGKTNEFKFVVTEKPRRSTQEMIQNGGGVL